LFQCNFFQSSHKWSLLYRYCRFALHGGNGIVYPDGEAVASSGVTGLTATLQAGTLSNGAGIAYQGVEPLSWTAGNTTYAPMKEDHAAMLAMLSSLTATELTSAKLSATFSDVLLGPNRDGQFPATKLGLKVSTLTATQKALVLAAMKPWVNDADDVPAAALLKIYEAELDKTYISG
jgi:Protein of unknown function (DUF3500)